MAEMSSISGLSELAAAIRELPQNIGKNVLRGAVSAAAKVVVDEAKVCVPVRTGLLKANIYRKQDRKSSGPVRQVFIVSVRQGRAKYAKTVINVRKRREGQSYATGGSAFYWRFIEFGTSKMAAKPFLRPAFEAKKEASVEAMRDYIAKRLPAEAEKLAKK